MNFHLKIGGLGALTEKLTANVRGQQEHQSVNITKVEELICSQEDALLVPTKVHVK